MSFLCEQRATSAVEWLVVAIIIVAVIGGTILALMHSIQARLEAINSAL